MINNQNITAYINYLHQKRTNQNASNELLQKWGSLSNAEIPTQLQNLYAHWGLDAASAQTHERNFLNFINPPIVVSNTYEPIAKTENIIAPKKKNYFWPILVGLLVLGGGIGGFMAWQNTDAIGSTDTQTASPTNSANSANNANNSNPAYTPSPNVVNPTSTAPIPDATVATNTTAAPSAEPVPDAAANTTLDITPKDKENIQNISNLLDAEQNRNFENIYNYFGADLRQYWDISMPNRDELQARYEDVWSKSSDGKNLNMKVSKVGNNKYRVTGQYEYYSIKSEVTKTVPVNTIFEFNEEGKIIYTNKAK
jgi:hypothetical protein